MGIDDNSVCANAYRALDRIRRLEAELGTTGREVAGWYAEQFIEGREFNVSLIETDVGPRTLPIARDLFP